MSSKALILVGGPSKGTRFRPLSLDLPKPLFEVAGHPIIWHNFKALSKTDIKEVILIGYYDESVFQPFIKEWSNEFPQFAIKYLREYQALGTAGGLYHFRDVILKGNPKTLFVLNADVCCSFPLREMQTLFEEKDAEAIILGTKVGAETATNFGCIVADPETKVVRHYVEKPESQISNLINCGVYLFSSSIFSIIKAAMSAKADKDAADPTIGPDEDESSVLRLEQDIFGELAENQKFYVYETRDFWRQIKTAGSANPANALYLQQAFQSGSKDLAAPSANVLPPVFIHPTAHVDPTAKIGPNVSVGPRAVVGAGVRIKDSIILEDVEIKHDACILYSIVATGSRIGAWARVEGSPTAHDNHETRIVKNGVKVTSVTILARECVVHDEVRVQNCVCLPFKELKRDVADEIIM